MPNTFTTASWDEKIVGGADEAAPRVAAVHAEFAYTGLIEGTSNCDYLLYYPGEGYDSGVSTSPGLERIEATVEGRRGTFVIRHEVGFDATGINGTFTVVDGSGTGELAGISGSGTITGAMDEPAMRYTFDHTVR